MEIVITYHLYEIRVRKGISSRKLAKMSEISAATINNIENHRCDPNLHTLIALSIALQVPLESLYSYTIFS